MNKIRVLKFESKTCAACIGMNKKGTLETIQREYPEVEVIALCIADKHGVSPAGSTYEEAYELSDLMGVNDLPTFVVTNDVGLEFARIEGVETLTNFRRVIEGTRAEIEKAAKLFTRVEAFKARPTEP